MHRFWHCKIVWKGFLLDRSMVDKLLEEKFNGKITTKTWEYL